MKKLSMMLVASLCLIITCLAQSVKDIDPYLAFLKTQKQSAKAYVLSLFKTHDIVVICERTHPEMTQYNLFTDIISDEWFIENVGNVFVEIGVSKLNPALNEFLHTRNLPAETVSNTITAFQRNASMWPIWSPKNYSVFYNKIYQLNNMLADEKQISVYPSDIPFSWLGADSAAITNLKAMLPVRDSIMAAQVITQFEGIKNSNQHRKKALVIMNFRHAFNGEFPLPGNRTLHNMAYFLFKQYGNAVANVFLNTVRYGKNDHKELLQHAKWDAAFNKAGRENTGFSFENSPFGKDSLDVWPLQSPYTYQDVFTGFIFYLPVEKQYLIDGATGLIDTVFQKELLRRTSLLSLVGGEFKAKMADIERVSSGDHPFLNLEEKKKYYQLDSLLAMRRRWLK